MAGTTIVATVADVSQMADGSVIRAIWTPVTEADTCAAVSQPNHSDKTMQVAGTFGGTSVALQGSIDGTNYAAMASPAGTAIAITAAGMASARDNALLVKPVLTGGSGATLTISILFHMTNPLRQ